MFVSPSSCSWMELMRGQGRSRRTTAAAAVAAAAAADAPIHCLTRQYAIRQETCAMLIIYNYLISYPMAERDLSQPRQKDMII
jgi:hypothetical protein